MKQANTKKSVGMVDNCLSTKFGVKSPDGFGDGQTDDGSREMTVALLCSITKRR